MPYSCHQCQTLLPTGTKTCPGCGLVFPNPVPSDAVETNQLIQPSPQPNAQQRQNDSVMPPTLSPCFKLYNEKIVGLDRLLSPGEKIVCISGGMMKTHVAGADTARAAVCAATDRRCIFYNRRMLGRYDFEDFAYDRITSVQVRKGLMWGAIDIYVAQVKKELYMTNNDCVEALGNFIREKIHYRTPLVEASPVQPQVDIAGQIRQLVELLQAGHLTQQEFDDMKRQLLSKMA